MSNKLYDITGEVKLDLKKFFQALKRADKEIQKLQRGQGRRKGLNSKNKLELDNKMAVRRLKQVDTTLKSLKRQTNLGTLKINVRNVNQSLSRVDKQLARIRKNASKAIVMPAVKGPAMPNGHVQPVHGGGQGGRGGVAFIPPGGKSDGRNIGDKIADYGRSPLSIGNLLGGAMLGNMMGKAMDFQSRMGMTYGKMGNVTPEQEREIRDLVLDVSGSSPKTSVQVAEVSEVLAGMGYSLDDMKNSLQSNVDLSVATASDPQLVADTLSGIIKTYDTAFTTADTDRVADKISKAINMSSLGMQQYAESSKYVDPVFAAAGIDFEEGLALQAMLADKNIKGSGAGTGLKNFLYGAISNKKEDRKRLQELGIKTRDETGAFSLEETLSSLNDTMEEHRKRDTEDEFVDRLVESFGRDGASAIAALAAYSTEEFRGYKGNLSDEKSAGATADLVEKATDNLAGDWNNLMSAVESTFNRMVTDNDSPLRGLVKGITNVVRWFDGLSNESKKLVIQIAAAVVGFPILINVIGRTISALIKFKDFLKFALTPLKLLSRLVLPKKAPSPPKPGSGSGKGDKGGRGGKGSGGKAVQLVQFAKTPSVKIAGCVKLCKGSGGSEKGGKGSGGLGVGVGGGKGSKKADEASKRNEKTGTGFGKNVTRFAKGIPVIGGLAGAMYALKDMTRENVGATVGGIGAGAVGGAAGATLGSMVMPGIGTVVGGVGGSLLGSVAGSKVGGFLDKNSDLLNPSDIKNKASQAKDAVVDTFSGIGPAITSAMSGIGTSIKGVFSSLMSSIISFAGTLGNVFMSIFTSIGTALVGAFTSVISSIGTVLGTVIQVIVSTLSAIPGIVASIFGAIVNTVMMFLTMLFSAIFSIMSAIVNVVISLFGALLGAVTSIFSSIFNFVVNIFSGMISAVAGLLSAMLGMVISIFSSLFGFITGILSSLLNFFISIFTTMISVAVSLLSSLLSAVVSVFNAIVSAVVSAGSRVVAAVVSFMGRAVQSVFSFAGRAFSAGANFVSGIARGIASGASSVINAASNVARNAFNAFKRTLAIRSPSRVMMRVAKWIPIGVAEGIEGEEAVVADSMARMSTIISSGLEVPEEGLPQITNPFAVGTNTNPINPKKTLTAAGMNELFSGGTVEVDRIIVNVDQLTDLSPQLVQSTVSAPFFDEARRRQ